MMDSGILAVLIASSVSFAGVAYTIWRQKPQAAADTEESRATAFNVYWARIEALETENKELKRDLEESERNYEIELRKLQIENQRLWAEIGRLKLKVESQ